jgi:hypothetical protein
MNMSMKIRSLQNQGRAIFALTLIVLLAAGGSTPAQAEGTLVAYGQAGSQELRADKVALDRAINGAAEQANADLTEAVRVELASRVRSKLRLATARTVGRG